MEKNKNNTISHIIYIVYNEIQIYINLELVSTFDLKVSNPIDVYKYLIKNFAKEKFLVLIENTDVVINRNNYSDVRKNISLKKVKQSELIMSYSKTQNNNEYNVIKLKDFSNKKKISEFIILLSESKIRILGFDLFDYIIKGYLVLAGISEENKDLIIVSKLRKKDSYLKIIAIENQIILLQRTLPLSDLKEHILSTKYYLETKFSKIYQKTKVVHISENAEEEIEDLENGKFVDQVIKMSSKDIYLFADFYETNDEDIGIDKAMVIAYLKYQKEPNKKTQYISTNKIHEENKTRKLVAKISIYILNFISIVSILYILMASLVIEKNQKKNSEQSKYLKQIELSATKTFSAEDIKKTEYMSSIIKYDSMIQKINFFDDIDKIYNYLKEADFITVNNYTIKCNNNCYSYNTTYEFNIQIDIKNKSGYQKDMDTKTDEIIKSTKEIFGEKYSISMNLPQKQLSITADKFSLSTTLKIEKKNYE